MSRDGLIPQAVCKIHPRFATPHRITILVGLAVALVIIAAICWQLFKPYHEADQLTIQ